MSHHGEHQALLQGRPQLPRQSGGENLRQPDQGWGQSVAAMTRMTMMTCSTGCCRWWRWSWWSGRRPGLLRWSLTCDSSRKSTSHEEKTRNDAGWFSPSSTINSIRCGDSQSVLSNIIPWLYPGFLHIFLAANLSDIVRVLVTKNITLLMRWFIYLLGCDWPGSEGRWWVGVGGGGGSTLLFHRHGQTEHYRSGPEVQHPTWLEVEILISSPRVKLIT